MLFLKKNFIFKIKLKILIKSRILCSVDVDNTVLYVLNELHIFKYFPSRTMASKFGKLLTDGAWHETTQTMTGGIIDI